MTSRETFDYFHSLFCPSDSSRPSLYTEFVLGLDRENAGRVTCSVTKDEVRHTLSSMKSCKSPGLNGFQAIFFKSYWDIISYDVWQFVNNVVLFGSFDTRVVETLIALIPKGNNPTSIKQFRPIILCNVTDKLITKVLVNRIRPFMNDIIGPLQSSLIMRHNTSNNVILAQEVIHHMHLSCSKNGHLVFKIDLEKVYDRVD